MFNIKVIKFPEDLKPFEVLEGVGHFLQTIKGFRVEREAGFIDKVYDIRGWGIELAIGLAEKKVPEQKEFPPTLTKEDFWNELMEKYPGEMSQFCYWVDEYKKKVGWDKLFGNTIDAVHYRVHQIKFHDIPVAMQIGVFYQFVTETAKRYELIPDMHTMNDFINTIKEWFAYEHEDAISNR